MATKKTDPAGSSPLADSIDPKQLAVTGTGDGIETLDARDPGKVPDRKDNPALPDDVSAIADPNDPTTIMDPGADPDFAGK